MCRGKTLKGKICKNPCVTGSRFCKIHGKNQKLMLKKVIEAQKDAAIYAERAQKLYEEYVNLEI